MCGGGVCPNDWDVEEKKMVLKRLRVLDRVGNGHMLCSLVYLNGWVGDRKRVGMTGWLGVSRENYNGSMVILVLKGGYVSVGNTYFEHESLLKYTRLARYQDGVEGTGMIDLVPVMKDILRYV